MWIFYKLILLGILIVCSIAAYYTLKENFENIKQPYGPREGTCSKEDLEEFIELQKTFKDSDLSWSVEISKVNQNTWDLSVKNPNGNEEVVNRSPVEIIAEMESLDMENQEILQRIRGLL